MANISLNILDPSLGIQNILEQRDTKHMPGARPMAATVLREPGLEDLYTTGNAEKILESALCPQVGDGEILRPDVFSAQLRSCLDNMESNDDPEVQSFVSHELRPMLEDSQLLQAYIGLMVAG